MVQWKNITSYQAFQKRLNRNLERATKLNALAAVKTMRQVITLGGFAPNAPLTVALKGSSKPIVAGGDLFQSITSQEVPGGYFVGVLRTDDGYDVVRIVHNGISIAVTPAMRWMFLLLSKASSGEMDPGKLEGRASELYSKFQSWKPLSESTSAIVIPARPFVTVTFERPDLIALCKKNWAEAVRLALNPPKREAASRLDKFAKKAAKLSKKASRLGKKAGKAGKKYGKKALKGGKRIGKKALRGSKRLGKKAFRGGKRFSKRAGKSIKRFGKRTTKRFRSKGGKKK